METHYETMQTNGQPVKLAPRVAAKRERHAVNYQQGDGYIPRGLRHHDLSHSMYVEMNFAEHQRNRGHQTNQTTEHADRTERTRITAQI